MEHELKTYGDLLEALKTFTPEQLAQKPYIFIDDAEFAEKIGSIGEYGQDIYSYDDDDENCGEIEDIKSCCKENNEEFDETKLKLMTPKGTIFLYNQWRSGFEDTKES